MKNFNEWLKKNIVSIITNVLLWLIPSSETVLLLVSRGTLHFERMTVEIIVNCIIGTLLVWLNVQIKRTKEQQQLLIEDSQVYFFINHIRMTESVHFITEFNQKTNKNDQAVTSFYHLIPINLQDYLKEEGEKLINMLTNTFHDLSRNEAIKILTRFKYEFNRNQ